MRILHVHSSFWSGRFFCQNVHILIRILQCLSENCNILMRIPQSRLLNLSFRGLFEVSWPVKYGYSHENIKILEWELQYSHRNIAICTASFGLWKLVGALLEPLWGYVAPVCSFLLQCLHIWINVANSWWHWNALPVPLPRQVCCSWCSTRSTLWRGRRIFDKLFHKAKQQCILRTCTLFS